MFWMTTRAEHVRPARGVESQTRLESAGGVVMRYGLVLILFWLGAMKFMQYESEGIEQLVTNSPFLAWAHRLLGLQTLAWVIGVIEITLALLIATRSFAPKLSAVGSFGAIVMFLITLSFTLTTPGVWQPGYGFPYPSLFGQFLLKDLILLGVAIWSAGEALRADAEETEYAAAPRRSVFMREKHP